MEMKSTDKELQVKMFELYELGWTKKKIGDCFGCTTRKVNTLLNRCSHWPIMYLTPVGVPLGSVIPRYKVGSSSNITEMLMSARRTFPEAEIIARYPIPETFKQHTFEYEIGKRLRAKGWIAVMRKSGRESEVYEVDADLLGAKYVFASVCGQTSSTMKLFQLS